MTESYYKRHLKDLEVVGSFEKNTENTESQ